ETVETTRGGTAAATTSAGASQQTIKVSETEFKITLPSTTLAPGPVTFTASNEGRIAHNLVVKGPQVSNASTSVFGPGKSKPLKVALTAGTYELYCSVPGHKEAGMDIKITVGKA
ncbi:MAG: plastocyanin/azurin family copper-binding protein, partial [Gaiellaceae bacterium]